MPGDQGIQPFDSFAGRLSDALNKAADEKTTADQESAPEPFDSYAGRLDNELRKARGEAPEVETPIEPEPAAPQPEQPLPDAEAGPAGGGDYVVKPGDCVESIAARHGLLWKSIWNDPANRELREARQNPNILLPGDRVAIREKRRKDEPGQTEQLHRFRRKGIPSRLQLRYYKRGEPRAGQRYVVTVDGRRHTGQLDADGKLNVPIPPDARRATVQIGDDARLQRLLLGSTDPISEISGVQCRLNNLGFPAGPNDNVLGPRTEKALREFQERCALEVTGEPDPPTRRKLVDLNGS